METVILKNLVLNEDYARKVVPFLQDEYFHDKSEKTVFNIVSKFLLNLAIIINPRRTATWGALAEFFAKKGNNTEVAVRALQLGYEFSGSREKTLQFFADNAVSSDRIEMRPIYAEAARRIRAYN
jgi:hypothetical protein